ncbi:prepilin-type N-terminal cleavage/methylation domain-containing protein [Schlesneria sp. DSM 10557]|uniref:prepilin-type N-terminal cleavage/methylation domain-containing protein n=1 Tax=Schlesneria sp. DSM 10557 TaxID=3044399 RepID=UPI0035A0406B
MQCKKTSVAGRAGFTLLEILVVISIIILLISIGGMVISNSIAQARERATLALLIKLDGMLQQRLDGFNTLISKPQRRTEMQTTGLKSLEADLRNKNIIGLPTATKMLMVRKEYFRNAFPQTQTDNSSLSYFSGNDTNPAESAEYLYWILTKSDSFGVASVDDSEFSAAELRDTDGDGRLEFVDAWGNPLRFYRWPTRLLRPGGPGSNIQSNVAGMLISGLPDASELQQDADDVVGVYDVAIESGIITGEQFEEMYHTPDTYSIPLIVSAGADGRLPGGLGLFEPNDSANFGHLAQPLPAVLSDPGASALNDNLTNRQKQK